MPIVAFLVTLFFAFLVAQFVSAPFAFLMLFAGGGLLAFREGIRTTSDLPGYLSKLQGPLEITGWLVVAVAGMALVGHLLALFGSVGSGCGIEISRSGPYRQC
jgi:hypothetical protein